MEVDNHNEADNREPLPQQQAGTSGLDLIRTETVLSRLPVHNLAKQGRVNIQIIKRTTSGDLELQWEVSYSDRYGQARQLAYKLDTIVINQRIDEAGRPLPRILRIGSLNEICAELNLVTHAGQNTKDLKRAFLQNASAFITAKFDYPAVDGSRRHVEAGITRYGVIFTGEKLPDGRKADAVYIVFNDPFWEVLNNAPVRPLDRAYMKELPPAAQRFYEIISRKIFAALKNNYARAKISYSEYCTFSAQLRHFERQRVQDQMAKVLRHHKESGYITEVRYEPTIDAENHPDWIMYFTPGPKARSEFAAAHRPRKSKLASTDPLETGEHEVNRNQSLMYSRRRTVSRAPQVQVDPALVEQFTRRGVTETKALAVLANLKPGQDVMAQLELGDHHIASNPGKYTNPAGFYIHLVEENTPIPEQFETSAKRKVREDEEAEKRRREDERQAEQELEAEYFWYCSEAIDRYIASLDPTEVAELRRAKWQQMRETYPSMSEELINSFTDRETRQELGKRAPVMTIEEFKVKREQGRPPCSEPGPDRPAEAISAEASASSPTTENDKLPLETPKDSATSEPVSASVPEPDQNPAANSVVHKDAAHNAVFDTPHDATATPVVPPLHVELPDNMPSPPETVRHDSAEPLPF